MKIINPKVKLLKQIDYGYELDDKSTQEDISNIQSTLFKNILDHIENCNANCFNYDLKESIQQKNNIDILEHGSVYLTIPISKPNPEDTEDYMNRMKIVNFYQNNPESVVKGYKSDEEGVLYVYFITTNYRVIVENDRHSDLIFLFNKSEYHAKRITFFITTNLFTAREISNIKYLSVSIGKPIIENEDIIITSHSFEESSEIKNSWINSCKDLYRIYNELVNSGVQSSSAYKILPETVAVNSIVTIFEDDFEKLFKTLEVNKDIDYNDIIHMILYDHDNDIINTEKSYEMEKENSEESPIEETKGDAGVLE